MQDRGVADRDRADEPAEQQSAAESTAPSNAIIDAIEANNPPPIAALDAAEVSPAPALRTTPIWPFRVAALAGAFVRSISDLSWTNWELITVLAIASLYTLISWRQPVPYRDERRVRAAILTEQLSITIAIGLTGTWASPLVLFLVPTGMLAGFAAGGLFSAYVAAAAIVAITVQDASLTSVRESLQDAGLWTALLGLVAFASGLAHRAAQDAERQQQVALDRVSQLAEANSLLFSLQRVAQSLPASLDLDEVLDATVTRLRTLLRHGSISVFLLDGDRAELVRSIGSVQTDGYWLKRLPQGLRAALDAPKAVRVNDMVLGRGVSRDARSGVYTSLRARGSVVGLIAVEFGTPGGYRQQQAEVLHGLSEPFGIAIDNARLFKRIRTLAADEERSRIARDLHDHIGSSLALVGFEIDRAISLSENGREVTPTLVELRDQVRTAVTDVRNTLFDLRTEVTSSRDLSSTTAGFLDQVSQRSGLRTDSRFALAYRLPAGIERELWQIIRESVVNAERHARAESISVVAVEENEVVTVSVLDDGVGIDATNPRNDSYGLIGMRERAARIGAELDAMSRPEGGTEVRIVVHRSSPDNVSGSDADTPVHMEDALRALGALQEGTARP